MNSEFKKFFPTVHIQPIIHDDVTQRYWINENLLIVTIDDNQVNVTEAIIEIIEAYVAAKRDAFESFIEQCRTVEAISSTKPAATTTFIADLLKPNVDARIFEIVSFAILKVYFSELSIFWGFTRDNLSEEAILLYKTGRTNANDGGIDFVMKPLGRFFQVTETLDVRKYFLDIDKIQRYPVTFVVKSESSAGVLRDLISKQARKLYKVDLIVKRYLDCIEEIINIPDLLERFDKVVAIGKLGEVIEEIVRQSHVEFNYADDEDDVADDQNSVANLGSTQAYSTLF